MSEEFTPQFPRTIARADWRAPLDHPAVEAVAKRLDHLYRNYGLSETHRAEMLVRYALLAEADKLIDALTRSMSMFAGRDMNNEPLRDPGIRPAKPVSGGASGGDALNAAVGFALRLAEWLKRLEDLYGVTAWKYLGEIVPRDEDGNPFLSPGDDI
ncbi:hypothetical protein [Bradyrhizobium sp. JYMT SZCCT0180]|uniref:hypothetical protein n=1 Tax=Bradyrhizobium sp. JYMT SZCCT0180 TaxID=2807666 RepID=UPI001BA8D051|nr:hypothetical protein [Bradyrhizobium sp. JYMT SZCCT0180]MBR1209469.1 hypothetical protein [Bradyrhizobium sp. JYMT SZCCT0180]